MSQSVWAATFANGPGRVIVRLGHVKVRLAGTVISVAEVDVMAAGAAQAERVPAGQDRGVGGGDEDHAGLGGAVAGGGADHAAEVGGALAARDVGPAGVAHDVAVAASFGGRVAGAAGGDRLAAPEELGGELG